MDPNTPSYGGIGLASSNLEPSSICSAVNVDARRPALIDARRAQCPTIPLKIENSAGFAAVAREACND